MVDQVQHEVNLGYRCSVCLREFQRPSALSSHVKTHAAPSKAAPNPPLINKLQSPPSSTTQSPSHATDPSMEQQQQQVSEGDQGESETALTSAASNKNKPKRRKSKPGGSQKRTAHSLSCKKQAIELVERLTAEKHSNPQRRATDTLGIPTSNISRWMQQSSTILAECATLPKSQERNRSHYVSKGKTTSMYRFRCFARRTSRFPLAEVAVYNLYREKRGLGKAVKGLWLRSEMRAQVCAIYGKCDDENFRKIAPHFRATKSWLQRFAARHRIRFKKRSNKKSVSVKEKEPRLQSWHANLRRRVKRHRDDEDYEWCDKYGCYPPNKR